MAVRLRRKLVESLVSRGLAEKISLERVEPVRVEYEYHCGQKDDDFSYLEPSLKRADELGADVIGFPKLAKNKYLFVRTKPGFYSELKR